MLHLMLLLLVFVPLADVVTTSSNHKDLSDVQTHLPGQSLRNIPAVPVKNVRSFQLFGGSDETNKRSVGAVKRSHFKGLALRRDEWASGLWPRGEVPYEMSPTYTSEERNKIRSAMDAFRKHTCIRFRPRAPSDMYYLSITNDARKNEKMECRSKVGRQTDIYSRTPEGKFKTGTNLHAPECLTPSTMLHELMHVIGFEHEHQREDRNPLINAARDPNPVYDYWGRLTYSRTEAYYMGNYDPESIMHYPFDNFKNYHRQYFSKSDIININKLYNCSV